MKLNKIEIRIVLSKILIMKKNVIETWYDPSSAYKILDILEQDLIKLL